MNQLKRIKEKFILAKQRDITLQVFGSESHRYDLGKPISRAVVDEFEKANNLSLPEAYKLFVTEIGNGTEDNDGYLHSGAGPYYGILPFGKGLNEVLYSDNPEEFLSHPCQLTEEMTEEEWKILYSVSDNDQLSDEEYNYLQGTVFGGLLPLGSQGCTITSNLILNGPLKGRIAYTNEDQKPILAFESNFLDWYERWLDEVISGDLIGDSAGWFGYHRGGTVEELWNGVLQHDSALRKIEYIDGLIKKNTIADDVLCKIEEYLPQCDGEVYLKLSRLLAKHDYNKAKIHLQECKDIDFCYCIQTVYWYAKEHANEWVEDLVNYLKTISDAETLRFCIYLLKEAKVDYGDYLFKSLQSKDESIRSLAYYALGQLDDKVKYLPQFMTGLQDQDESVLISVLQALQEVKEDSLLPYYKNIVVKYIDREDTYVNSNLDYRLKEYNLTRVSLLKA